MERAGIKGRGIMGEQKEKNKKEQMNTTLL